MSLKIRALLAGCISICAFALNVSGQSLDDFNNTLTPGTTAIVKDHEGKVISDTSATNTINLTTQKPQSVKLNDAQTKDIESKAVEIYKTLSALEKYLKDINSQLTIDEKKFYLDRASYYKDKEEYIEPFLKIISELEKQQQQTITSNNNSGNTQLIDFKEELKAIKKALTTQIKNVESMLNCTIGNIEQYKAKSLEDNNKELYDKETNTFGDADKQFVGDIPVIEDL